MSDLFWLPNAHMAHFEPFFPKSQVVSKIFRTFFQATAPWVEVCSA